MSTITASPTESQQAFSLSKLFRANIQTYALIVALVILWLFFAWQTKGAYVGPQNFSNLFRQMTITALLSVGMVLVIVTGNIDLSVGKLAGFVSVVVAYLQARVWTTSTFVGTPEAVTTLISVAVGLLVGMLSGVIQGYIIAYFRVPSFIVTLGGLWIFNGLILIVTGGKTIPANQPIFSQISQGYLPRDMGWILAVLIVIWLFYAMITNRQKKEKYGFDLTPLYIDVLKSVLMAGAVAAYVAMVNQYNGVQIPVLLLAVVALIVSYMSTNTRFGRYAYAIGGNREAARLSGVNIRKNNFLVFVMMGFLAGVAGTALASYVGFGTTSAGDGYELEAIAACILGGTSTLGGEGTIFGAMIGALIIASLTNGLQMMNVPPAWQYLLKGIVLVIAVFADVQLKKNR
jgi:D-xylose transport system permease protein